jgi:hypothetical protein
VLRRFREIGRPPAARWALLAAGYTLVVIAWLAGDPPSALPDEHASQIRAAGVGQGDWEGRPGPLDPTSVEDATPQQLAFLEGNARSFLIPSRLKPIYPLCFAFKPEQPAACQASGSREAGGSELVSSYVGNYPPFAYLLPGLAMRFAPDPVAAGLLGRAGSALPCLLLLAVAMWLLDGAGNAWRLAGAVLSATPMTLFLASGLNPSGVETCAGLCFGAGLVALASGRRGARVWAALAASGGTLALSRPASSALVAAIFLAGAPILPWRMLRRRPAAPLLAALAIASSVALAAAWAAAHQPRTGVHLGALPAALKHTLGSVEPLSREMVGIFGWLDTHLPRVFYVAWWAAAGTVAAAAVLLGRNAERAAVLIAAAAVAGYAAVILGLVLEPGGFDLQGRYLLPIAVFIPLVGGFVLHRRNILPGLGPLLVGAMAAAVQFGAFWYNSRRYAVGSQGPALFLPTAQWSPPWGWPVVLGLAAAGSLLLVIALIPGRPVSGGGAEE